MTTTQPAGCDASSALIQEFVCASEPTCLVSTNDRGTTQLPTEPFGMQIDSVNRRLLVSSLATGKVSVIDIDADVKSALLSESTPFFPPDGTGRHGAFALAAQFPGVPNTSWYLTSNVNAQIATFRVSDSTIVIPEEQFGIGTSFAQGTDVRDLIFDVDGNRAFVTENNPPSVLVIDTRRPSAQDMSGNANNVVTDIIDVCQTPSHMGARRLLRPGAPGAPSQVKNKLVVACFLSSQVMIVDPDRPGVDDTVFSGFGGPNDLTFNFPNYGEIDAAGNKSSLNVITPVAPAHAYVTNYTESTVSVVDLQPGSPSENRVIARLGFPPDGFNP
jgi:hypothetical protein